MSGLQCWDASGKLVVDLGDYMLKKQAEVRVPSKTGSYKQVNIPITGVTASCFAVLNTDYIQDNTWVTACYDGGVTIYFTLGQYFSGTATLEVYSYI
ncbi:hypothetical protein [Cronobacter sakazakii]|uniref:hypothetical protein n=1 Tax=Cronobacter sakazakii TaxID=28141 RepID=UPI000BE9A32D|nr:hypothetical protein [Cronobacter sakazakii]ELQ6036669.1 hypothetical protein [Cronobacter sakazakii]PUV43717.1 hypothetical protein CDU02_16335 [Cronobacter sakazakii]